ncbi:MAG TPA: ATP-binding protein [Anaerolineales bacterium]|nr:ATP-binding protein [Anaerolineales bacterium]
MLQKFRWRIAIPYVLLILVTMTGLGLYLGYSIRQSELEDLEAQLRVEAWLLSQLVGPEIARPPEPGSLDRQVEVWADTLGSRVTLIALDGSVLADSEENAQGMDNHLDRPEVRQAIEQGEGKSVRFSQTQGNTRIYYAVPVKQGDQILGIVRLSLPLKEVQQELTVLGRTIFFATLVAAGLAVLIAAIIAEFITRPLRNLTQAIHRASLEEPGEIMVPDSPDEVGQLARSFNALKNQLQIRSTEVETERNKLAAVLDQMADGVIIVDSRGRVMLINPAAEEIFTVSEQDAYNRSVVQVLRQHQIIELWRECVASGISQVVYVELITKRLFLQGFATPLENALAGSILLVFQDVTQLRLLETVRRDFISNISHELRTPLASLKALSETLLDSALDDPQAARRFLTRMETEVDALSLMVQELVELSRIESGKVPLHLVAIHPGDLLQPPVERLRLQAERAGLQLEVDCPADLPFVLADPPRMEQVIVNLLHNAIKFTPPGGKVILTARQEGDTINFSVEDNGEGISLEDLPRIFERFYKADRARSGGGTGLGLAIARHLVEAHAGRIWAESVQGQGSTFTFSLPLAN